MEFSLKFDPPQLYTMWKTLQKIIFVPKITYIQIYLAQKMQFM